MRLRNLRINSSLSQATIAAELHVSPQAISKWEDIDDTALPAYEALETICRLYNCSIEQILGFRQNTQFEGTDFEWRINEDLRRANTSEPDIELGIQLFQIVSQANFVLQDSPFANMPVTRLERILTAVLRTGVITITNVEHDMEIEQMLQKNYQLKHCHIVKTTGQYRAFLRPLHTELVAYLARQPILHELQHIQSLGISGGSTIGRWIEGLPFGSLKNIDVYALLSVKNWRSRQIATSADVLLSHLVYKNPEVATYNMPFLNKDRREPEHLEKAGSEEQEELRLARERLVRAANVDVALVSAGDAQRDHVRFEPSVRSTEFLAAFAEMREEYRTQIVGDILLRFVDKYGNRVGTEADIKMNEAWVTSIKLEDLQKMVTGERQRQVWLLISDPAKANLVNAVLTGQYVNCLVTTSEMARRMSNS